VTAITHAISAALLHFAWEGLLIALLLWIALAILRNGSARHRYFVSCAALGIMTVLPVVTAWFLYRPPTAADMSGQVVIWPQSASPSALPEAASLAASIATVESWTLPVWFLGVLVFAIRLILISRHVAELQRQGEPAGAPLIDTITHLAQRMRVRGPLRVLISRLTDTLCVVGWLRPVILLPAATLLSLSVEQLETVLAHELAHIRRRDYLVNLLQTASETLLFYHPAVWWVSARIRHERELCCDDMVVAVCGDAIGYARALTKFERLRMIAPELAMSGTGGSLLYRIRRLTGMPHEEAPSKAPAVVSLVLAIVCFAISPHWASGQPQLSHEAAVSRENVQIDTVKRGDLAVMVRALGTIISSKTAELKVDASQASLIQVGQTASLAPRQGFTIQGTVARIDPNPANGTVGVAIDLKAPVPEAAGVPVDGTIRIRVLKDVVYVGRPVFAAADSRYGLFKLETDVSHATRVGVRFGAASVDAIQILEGLQAGDRVILSDMSKYDGYGRIRVE
jgi:beta-lactamase regulating signal transducer with metallopeptidase domain